MKNSLIENPNNEKMVAVNNSDKKVAVDNKEKQLVLDSNAKNVVVDNNAKKIVADSNEKKVVVEAEKKTTSKQLTLTVKIVYYILFFVSTTVGVFLANFIGMALEGAGINLHINWGDSQSMLIVSRIIALTIIIAIMILLKIIFDKALERSKPRKKIIAFLLINSFVILITTYFVLGVVTH